MVDSNVHEKYRLHGLMRRHFREQTDEPTRLADDAMVQYFSRKANQGDREAIIERIYHHNRLEPDNGSREWASTLEAALQASDYFLCERLIDLKTELIIAGDFERGLVADNAGEFYSRISRHNLSVRELKFAVIAYDRAICTTIDKADAYNNKGNSLARIADIESQLSQYEAAFRSYALAIEAFSSAMRRLRIHRRDQ